MKPTVPSRTDRQRPQDDEEVRALLHAAVADVEPTRDLDDVRDRVRGPRGSSSYRWPALVAAALVTVLALGGTTWLAGRTGDPAGPAASAEASSVRAWVVERTPAGPRLVTDRRPLPPGADPVEVAVAETLDGTPSRAGIEQAWSGSGLTAEVTRDGSTVVVRLESDRARSGGAPDPATVRLLPQAVVWAVATATGDPETRVDLTVDGDPTESFSDLDLGRALRPDTAPEVVAPVVLTGIGEERGEGGTATTGSPFTVTGLAAAFEATVVWELRQDDQVVADGFTTAEECCAASPFSFEVEAPPGEYELRVAETDPSDGEGFPAYVARERVRVE